MQRQGSDTASTTINDETKCEVSNAETRTDSLGDLASGDHHHDSSEKSDIIPDPDPDPDADVTSDDDSDTTEGQWGCDCREGECDTSECDCVATFGQSSPRPELWDRVWADVCRLLLQITLAV